jgi:hypothetical protein
LVVGTLANAKLCVRGLKVDTVAAPVLRAAAIYTAVMLARFLNLGDQRVTKRVIHRLRNQIRENNHRRAKLPFPLFVVTEAQFKGMVGQSNLLVQIPFPGMFRWAKHGPHSFL